MHQGNHVSRCEFDQYTLSYCPLPGYSVIQGRWRLCAMYDFQFLLKERRPRPRRTVGLPLVAGFFQGYLGQPVGGFPEPLRSRIIRNKPKIGGRPGASLQPLEFKKIKAELQSKFGKHITDSNVTSYVMYPKVRIF